MIFLVFLALGYVFILGQYVYFWEKIPKTKPITIVQPTCLAVVVVARNEAGGIAACIEALLGQDYPLDACEFWLVDDDSQDETLDIMRRYQHPSLRVCSLAELPMDNFGQAYKKRAIAGVLRQTQAELILTTDADCIPPPTWLRAMVSRYQATGADCLAGPVVFSPYASWLERFEALDFLGMMLLTGAGLQGRFQLLCNGANFAYTRSIYERVNGFEGLTDYASGDDLLLLKKIRTQVPEAKLVFVKDLGAAVPTLAQPTWRSFLGQRLRWASKSGHRPWEDWGGTWRLLWVAAFATGLCLAPLLAYWWTMGDFMGYLLAWLFKFRADAYLLWPATAFFQRKELRKIFFLSVFLHAFYIFSVALLSNVQKSYLWKGRRLR